MRIGALAFLVLVAGSGLGRAQATEGSWADSMFPEGTKHDFGTVPLGTQLLHRYKIKNKFGVPLNIATRVGCNCLSASATNDKEQVITVLQPKEVGYIDVMMDAKRFQGPRSVKVYVDVTQGQYFSTATLHVSAISRVDVVLNPGSVNFGVVARGQKAVQTLDVEYAGALNWQVNELVKHNAPFEATYRELYRRPGQVGYRVTVSINSDAPAGSLRHEVFLKTNDLASPLVPILVEANIRASLSLAPKDIALGNLKIGDKVTKKVVVSGAKAFRVVAVEGIGDGLSAQISGTPSTTQIITLVYEPKKAENLIRQLKIKTDMDQATPLAVTVEGSVKPK
jgi:hypothetical protein